MHWLEIFSTFNVKGEQFQKKLRRKFVKTSVVISFSIFLALNKTRQFYSKIIWQSIWKRFYRWTLNLYVLFGRRIRIVTIMKMIKLRLAENYLCIWTTLCLYTTETHDDSKGKWFYYIPKLKLGMINFSFAVQGIALLSKLLSIFYRSNSLVYFNMVWLFS